MRGSLGWGLWSAWAEGEDVDGCERREARSDEVDRRELILGDRFVEFVMGTPREGLSGALVVVGLAEGRVFHVDCDLAFVFEILECLGKTFDPSARLDVITKNTGFN